MTVPGVGLRPIPPAGGVRDLAARRAPSGPARAVGSEEAALVWRLPLTAKGNLERSRPGGS
jgi:hypothetical protein